MDGIYCALEEIACTLKDIWRALEYIGDKLPTSGQTDEEQDQHTDGQVVPPLYDFDRPARPKYE